MKTIKVLFTVILATFLFSCETEGPMGPPGPVGPPGYDGADGEDGTALVGTIIDIEGDFSAENDYRLSYAFPANLEIYETDVVLVYILWEVAPTDDGNNLDVWRLLPQTLILDEGVLQYNYDYTFADVQIFLEGTVDFNSLSNADLNNQVFRIAILPAAEIEAKSIDVTDIKAVAKSARLNLQNIPKYSVDSK